MIEFTPSERVVLAPDAFTGEGGVLTSRVEVPDGRKLASRGLGTAAVAAAFLAAEAEGDLRLEFETGKALFGLIRTRTFTAFPTGSRTAWPDGSLEARIVAATADGPRPVKLIVTDLIGGDQTDPAAFLVLRVQAALADRGRLEAEETRTLGVFTRARYRLTPATQAALGPAGGAPAADLLDGARRTRPETWTALESAVRGGINLMVESSD